MKIDIIRSSPYVEIIEQPASNCSRFRYKCEHKSNAPIHGVNSTSEKKTFPSIRIIRYRGRAKITVSCVTKDGPYRPHPYNLVGGRRCKHGVYTVEVSSENITKNIYINIDCI
ncbi:embryonic polarity protein dorsal-like [Bombus vosnesenskii]|uniref:Embryonic polarity protein dorsal-like n=1 Tax=Bombus vosnesenskii TaxID=207650 RepID=A0A6J3KA02_9HYME|nr:embryonic polarity protein dorsal-like [Bombus vosnesenskii]